MKTTFTTKEEYLAYRQMWKAWYKDLSAAIRNEKLVRKDCCRNPITGFDGKNQQWTRTRPWTEQEQLRIDKHDTDVKKFKEFFGVNYLPGYSLSGFATQMLTELKLAKEEAQRQYLASMSQMQAV